MDTGGFSVNTDNLSRDVSEMKHELEQLKSGFTKMSDLVRELDATWDGAANQALVTSFEKDNATAKDFFTELAAALELFSDAVLEYNTCESSVKAEVARIHIG